MNTSRTKWMLAAATALSFSGTAFAQDTDAAPARGGVDTDIIVTARRVEERLQDVPISISVYTQEQLTNRNVTNGTDLANYTPSVQADTRFGTNNATFAIRGFRQDTRTTASVGVYFAEVVAQRGGQAGSPAGDGAGPGSFFDLQNVQVLKGPQGTLFGRNTTGGAILLVPQKPTGEFGGYVQGTYGNYDQKRVEAVVNVPLGENARFRAGIDWNDRDGYLKNISPTGPRDFNDIHYIAARASLVVDLTPDLENYTIVSFAHAQDNGPMAKVTDAVAGPGCTFAPPAAPALIVASIFGNLACQQIAREGSNPYVIENTLANPKNELRTWQVINTTTLKASDTLTIKNIVSYSQLMNDIRAEIFGTYFVMPTGGLGPFPGALTDQYAGRVLGFAQSFSAPGLNTADQQTFTEELQFQGSAADGRLDWQAGAYYERSTPTSVSGTQSPVFASCTDSANQVCTDPIGGILTAVSPTPASVGRLAQTSARVSFRNVGVYAQGTFALTEQLKLTAGLRYTWDKTLASARLANLTFPAAGGIVTTCSVPGTEVADCSFSEGTSSKAPTWVIGLDYKPIDDVLLYAKYSRGYRQGSVSYNSPPPYRAYKPEKVDAYEVGLKTTFNGFVRGTFNISGFYNKFQDQQLSIGVADLGTVDGVANEVPATIAIINAGKSRIWGFEVDTSISPFEGLVIDGSYAYLNTKVIDIPTDYSAPGSEYDTFTLPVQPGERLPLTPTHKFSITGTYTLPLSEEIGRVSLGATYTYSSNYRYQGPVVGLPLPPAVGIDGEPFQADKGVLPSLGLLNLNLNWKSVMGSPVDLGFFATNVTKKKYFTSVYDQRQSGGFISQLVGEPRMYGLRLRYNFGQ